VGKFDIGTKYNRFFIGRKEGNLSIIYLLVYMDLYYDGDYIRKYPRLYLPN
jgi:hypothetical protein